MLVDCSSLCGRNAVTIMSRYGNTNTNAIRYAAVTMTMVFQAGRPSPARLFLRAGGASSANGGVAMADIYSTSDFHRLKRKNKPTITMMSPKLTTDIAADSPRSDPFRMYM